MGRISWQIGLSVMLGLLSLQALGAPKELISSWEISSKNRVLLDQVAQDFEVVSRKGHTFQIYVDEAKKRQFLRLFPNAKLLSADIANELALNVQTDFQFLSGYRNYEEVNSTLMQLASSHPEFISLQKIGVSKSGKVQYALKLSDHASQDEDEPELMLTAATHGDEIVTTEVLLRFLEELVEKYKQDPRITDIIDRHEIFFIPIVNPDGFINRNRYVEGTDPNRDFPWPENPSKSSVSCISNLISFFDNHQIVGSMDFHAFGRLVMYPWAYTRSTPEPFDEGIFSRLSTSMVADNHYTAGQISKVIYIAQGSSADYYYWKKKTVAFGIELSDSKAPRSDRIPEILQESREMTLRFIEYFQ